MAQSRSGKKSTKNSSGKKSTASSRGTGRSSTGRSASARSSAASRSRQPSRRAQRRAETPNLARSILLVGLGLLCVALVLVPGQNLWRTLRSWYFGVFGITTYLVGPFLLYLAYLLATGYRVALFAGKVSLMGVLCASVPVIFSKLNIENLKVGEIVKMLFTRGGTYFWEGGVLGAPIGATLLALFGRPASNIIMLLIFLLGLMFFFAITPADVVLFVDGQYKTLQAKREERAAAETAYDTPEEEPPADLHGLHLLMAEDNELNREIAVTLLEEQGAAITTAENGREAVELFQNAPQGTFDAVLMDVMMPEMNGLEATRAIRAFEHCPPESGIPIIAMTANVFADDVKACLEAGMNSHVGKPLDMQVLAAEICRQMRRHTALLESADFTKLGN